MGFPNNPSNDQIRTHADGRRWKYKSSKGVWRIEPKETELLKEGGDITGQINLADSVKATFGASNDLQIYHDGSNSNIADTGTGWLYLRADERVIVASQSTGNVSAKFFTNAQAELAYNNATKLATTSTGIDVTGTVAATSFSGDGSNLTNLPGGGKVLGMKHLKYRGRFQTSGRITPLTVSYTKKITNSKLVIQSFIWGESNSHNSTLRIWNSVDGYFSDGSQGESDCSVKLDQGEYYSSDTNSTPGSASHIAVTSDIAANTNVEFRWYVSSNTSVIGGSWGGSYEHAACWMVVTEIEND